MIVISDLVRSTGIDASSRTWVINNARLGLVSQLWLTYVLSAERFCRPYLNMNCRTA